MLKDTGKLAYKLASIFIDPNHKLGPVKDDIEIDKGTYQRLVRRLIYLSHTIPNIAYAVSVISQPIYNPKEVHL